MSAIAIIADIIANASAAADLVAKVRANISKAGEVLAAHPDASLEQQLTDAKAKLAEIQGQAADADAEFDAALAQLKN